jgi:hypothetical protein
MLSHILDRLGRVVEGPGHLLIHPTGNLPAHPTENVAPFDLHCRSELLAQYLTLRDIYLNDVPLVQGLPPVGLDIQLKVQPNQ